jgi:hypothetical protein
MRRAGFLKAGVSPISRDRLEFLLLFLDGFEKTEKMPREE